MRVVRIVAPGGCLGVRLVPRNRAGHQAILLVPGLTSVEVDWRTNPGANSDGIAMPDASDWHIVTLAELARAEPGCLRHAGGWLAPPAGPDYLAARKPAILPGRRTSAGAIPQTKGRCE